MLPDEFLQIGQQQVFTQRCADADMQGAAVSGGLPADSLLAQGDGLKSILHMGVEHGTLMGQGDAPAVPVEQGDAQRLFQFLNGLADGGLADVQLPGCPGNILGVGYCIKNLIKRKCGFHGISFL